MLNSEPKTTMATDKATFWRNHLKGWQSSGMSQIAYCQQHGLKIHNFHYWRRRLRGEKARSLGQLRLVPITDSTMPEVRPGQTMRLSVGDAVLEIGADVEAAALKGFVWALRG
jgi:hypothetical protein